MKLSSLTDDQMANYRQWRDIGKTIPEAIKLGMEGPPRIEDYIALMGLDWVERITKSVENRRRYQDNGGTPNYTSIKKLRTQSLLIRKIENQASSSARPVIVPTIFEELWDFTIPQNAPLDLQQIHGMQDQFGSPIESITTDLKTFFKYSQLDWGVDPAADVETGEIEQ